MTDVMTVTGSGHGIGAAIARAALLVMLALHCTQAGAQSSGFGAAELTIETATKAAHHFNVLVASTPAQQAQGLMFVSDMPDDRGMLFDFTPGRPVSMWMKNTLISLDMLFINAKGIIVNIAARTTPGSLDTLSSHGSVLGVLEINGGLAERLGIQAGDRVRHALFGD